MPKQNAVLLAITAHENTSGRTEKHTFKSLDSTTESGDV
jgi:hypothetical protein